MRIGPLELVALLGHWREGDGSLAARLAAGVRAAIASGSVPAPCALPTERALAEALGCSRSTVTHAFDDLEADGLVVRRQGSGTAVPELPGDPGGGPGLRRVFGSRHLIDLSVAAPPSAPPWLTELVRSIDLDDLHAGGPQAHGYEAAGARPLRVAIGERLGVDPSRVLVTNGAHHGLFMALSALLRPGARLAVEDPIYPGVFDLAEHLGARLVPVDAIGLSDASSALDRLAALRPAAVVVQPRIAAPTGRAVPFDCRLELAEVLDAVGAPVVEDDALGDLGFHDVGGQLLHARRRRVPVWSVGSLSKTIWGGLRVGWLVAPSPAAAAAVSAARMGIDLAPSSVAQAVAHAVLPRLDEIAAQRRASLAGAAATLVDLLHHRLPSWRPTMPEGGLTLWADIGADAERFTATALANGVAVTVGTAASRSPSARQHIRLCVDRSEQQLSAGVARLERAWLAH